jgi:hypothetical protein
MAWAHEREHFRVAYPTALRPKLLIQGHTFDVVDISEAGIRFRLGQATPPEPGFELQGAVRFKRGETCTVRGIVLRVIDGEVAAKLEEGLPARVIREEQRFLLDRHRHLGI